MFGGNMDNILIFSDGKLYVGVYELINSTTIKLFKSKAAKYQEVVLINLDSGNLIHLNYFDNSMSLKEQLKSEFTYWKGLERGQMAVPSITNWEHLKSDINEKYGPHEVVFVNGKPYDGQIEFDRYKGIGWESGRTASVCLYSPVDPSSEVYVVDLRYLRLRKCKLLPKSFIRNAQEWECIDLPEDVK
jgi:hypothetical protein